MQTLLTYIFPLILSSFCDQEFLFVGVTKSNADVPTIVIVEHVGGQCYYSKLIQIAVAETSVSMIESNFKQYRNTQQFVESFTTFDQLPFIALTKDEGGFSYLTKPAFAISEPVPDSLMLAKSFADGARKYPGSIKLPAFKMADAKLLFSYNSGLYVNYHIDKVIFVPIHGILIVFTKHPLLHSGGDTMHGFMIFRLRLE